MRKPAPEKKLTNFFVIVAVTGLLFSSSAEDVRAASAVEIDSSVEATLERFYKEVESGKKLVQDAKGILIFPAVYKAGFGFGGEYGEGSLLIGGKVADYYSTAAASVGFQIGVQKKSIIILFMQDEVLNHLRQSANWKAGADASIAIISLGANGSIDTAKLNEPIIAFVIGQKGLMYNLTLEGAKFTKLNKK